MDYTITLLPGDGIGPEVTSAAVACVEATAKKHNFGVTWEREFIGETSVKMGNEVLEEGVLDSIRKNKVALKGPTTTPMGYGFRSVNVALRRRLDLYANLRPARLLPGVKSRYSAVDITVIRENTEDLYAEIEFDVGKRDTARFIKFIEVTLGIQKRKDSAVAVRPISEFGSKRIAKYAFENAKLFKRKKVTAVHKSNILKFTDGLFLRSSQEVAKNYKNIPFDTMVFDNLCQNLVTKPEQFDVLLCPNFYGDVVSELCAGLVVGVGVAPAANMGDKIAVFEPAHGSSPKHAGKNEVNPTASILSAVMMLHYIGQEKAALDLERAVIEVLAEGRVVTYDINPIKPASTTAMTAEIINKLGVK